MSALCKAIKPIVVASWMWSLCWSVMAMHPNESTAQMPPTTMILKSVRLYGAKEITNAELQTVFPTPAPFDSLTFKAQLDELKKRYIRSGYYDVRIDSVRWRVEPEAYQHLHAEIFLARDR